MIKRIATLHTNAKEDDVTKRFKKYICNKKIKERLLSVECFDESTIFLTISESVIIRRYLYKENIKDLDSNSALENFDMTTFNN